jgi:thiol-disulfide isomerase/thioredoxin
MRYSRLLVLFFISAAPSLAQLPPAGPASEKAQKSYKKALEEVRQHRQDLALDEFKKADKQDEGRCLACQKKMIQYGLELHEWKTALAAAKEMVAEAQGDESVALAHFEVGIVLLNEGRDKHKDELWARAHDEFTRSLAAFRDFPEALLADGQALAQLKQDAGAKAQFEKYVQLKPVGEPERQRALRYITEPELARARMAPPFAIDTLDGQHISMDDLAGKVVLLDFWATWCGPCRAAMPHIREIAKKFQGQPLIVLSVSLDSDEQKWKEFISKNGMTWLHYRDAGSAGSIANLFGVKAIPHTFTIDADGVLQDERIGDASIEGKLKKLVARARELEAPQKPPE